MVEENIGNVNRKTGFINNLIMTGEIYRFIVYLITVVPLAVLIVFSLLSMLEIINPINIAGFLIGTWYDYIIIGLVISTGVFGIYEFLRLRRVRKIDDRFPDFVRDIAESRRAGMTFVKSILNASKGNYGVLTSEIQKIARQISWGSSIDAALSAFAKRVNTKLIRRTVSLIIEASRSGGNVADVLDAASKDAREIKFIESERRANMLSYVAVIYVSMFVFLVIIIVVSKTLIPNMISEGVSGNVGTALSTSVVTQAEVTMLFFWAGIVQSGFMGLVAGIFEEGNAIAGIKHSFIMIIINWVVLKIIVGGI